MGAVLTELINILVAGISSLATGIGGGLNDLVTSIFVDTSGTTPALTTFGGVIAIFGGIALAVGLSRLVTQWVMSLGARK